MTPGERLRPYACRAAVRQSLPDLESLPVESLPDLARLPCSMHAGLLKAALPDFGMPQHCRPGIMPPGTIKTFREHVPAAPHVQRALTASRPRLLNHRASGIARPHVRSAIRPARHTPEGCAFCRLPSCRAARQTGRTKHHPACRKRLARLNGQQTPQPGRICRETGTNGPNGPWWRACSRPPWVWQP